MGLFHYKQMSNENFPIVVENSRKGGKVLIRDGRSYQASKGKLKEPIELESDEDEVAFLDPDLLGMPTYTPFYLTLKSHQVRLNEPENSSLDFLKCCLV